MSDKRLLVWRVRKGRECVECWVSVTTEGAFTVTFEGAVLGAPQTFLGWNSAARLVAERRAVLLESGWLADYVWSVPG